MINLLIIILNLFFLVLCSEAEDVKTKEKELLENLLDLEEEFFKNSSTDEEKKRNDFELEVYYKDIETYKSLKYQHASVNPKIILRMVKNSIQNFLYNFHIKAPFYFKEGFFFENPDEGIVYNIEIDYISKLIYKKQIDIFFENETQTNFNTNKSLEEHNNTNFKSKFSLKKNDFSIHDVDPRNIWKFLINFFNVYSGNCYNNRYVNCLMCNYMPLFKKIKFDQVLKIFFEDFTIKNIKDLLYLKCFIKWISKYIFHLSCISNEIYREDESAYVGRKKLYFTNKNYLIFLEDLIPNFSNLLYFFLFDENLSLKEYYYKLLLISSIKKICSRLIEIQYINKKNIYFNTHFIEIYKNRNLIQQLFLNIYKSGSIYDKYLDGFKKIVLAEAIVLYFHQKTNLQRIKEYIDCISHVLFQISIFTHKIYEQDISNRICNRIINFSLEFVEADSKLNIISFYDLLEKDELKYIIKFKDNMNKDCLNIFDRYNFLINK